MPILEIEIVGDPDEPRRSGLARRLADAAGLALGAGPQSTWVRLRILPEDDYAENGAENDAGPADGVRPVFVSLLLARPPKGAELDERVRRLTQAVAEQVGRPAENVHVLLEPAAAGRIAFGGELRT